MRLGVPVVAYVVDKTFITMASDTGLGLDAYKNVHVVISLTPIPRTAIPKTTTTRLDATTYILFSR